MFEPVPRIEPVAFSADQDAAWAAMAARLAEVGVDLAAGRVATPAPAGGGIVAVTGKAGSGKTVLLARLAEALAAAGLVTVTPDWESTRYRRERSVAVLTPTNKAASVLRAKGVAATTIHRILYTPVYDPEFEKIAEWLEAGKTEAPPTGALTAEAIERAQRSYAAHGSIPGALAAAGVRGADFITGWTRRRDPLDIALVDEASMIDADQLADLEALFGLIVLFGDPAQLAPVKARGRMIFERLPAERVHHLGRVFRQAAGSPILDLAHALGDEAMDFPAFEALVEEKAADDDRVLIAPRADADLMRESPVLVWRNATRMRLIRAFRAAQGCPEDALVPGEPLICDGLELPLKERRQRIELERRGLIKGAQARYLGPGRRPGYARVDIAGTDEPGISVAAIIQIESPDEAEPRLLSAARMGAVFLHGAACTIHKAQGSQWPSVQLFAPDLHAAARSGQVEGGVPLWKRLAYVAVTRAEERLIWVTRYRISRPEVPLGPPAG